MTEFRLPIGFSAGAVNCGVKDPTAPRKDLAVFLSDRPCQAAGVFTTNLVCGAPVKVSRSRLPSSSVRGVIINSGNANACTGEQGNRDAEMMTALVAEAVGCGPKEILVCSTGVIGRLLPMDRISRSIPSLVRAAESKPAGLLSAAQAMMTTDTVHKISSRNIKFADRGVTVTGVCKGAAMISPNMATMLCVIMTDAGITREESDQVLRRAVQDSFNCISVDGHESTSDSVLFLSNGAAGAAKSEAEKQAFANAVREVATELAIAIIRDAEGASHFIQLDVTGCRTREEAFKIAKSISESPLVKTAIYGADPNWGRIVSAAGYAGVNCREEDISLKMNGVSLYESGTPISFDAKAVSTQLRQNRDVSIEVSLRLGGESIRFWTSDLTKEYVELNADYTT